MEAQKVEPNEVTLTSILSACERTHRWAEALAALSGSAGLRAAKPQPFLAAVHWNAALGACAAGSAWKQGLSIFAELWPD